MEKNNKQMLSEAEIELLKEALKRSYKERFEMATRLYKIQQTMSKASIVHKPFISK
jgi:rRNA maturation endonuclease Nob1